MRRYALLDARYATESDELAAARVHIRWPDTLKVANAHFAELLAGARAAAEPASTQGKSTQPNAEVPRAHAPQHAKGCSTSELDSPSGLHWQAVNAGEALVPPRVGADSDSLAADDSNRSSSEDSGEQSLQSCRRQSSSEGGSGDGRAQPRTTQRSGGEALAKPVPRARSSGRATRQSTSSERSAETSSDCAATSQDDSADVAGPSRRQAQPERSISADSSRQRDRRGMATRKRGRPAPGSLSEKALQGEDTSPDTSGASESDVPVAKRAKRDSRAGTATRSVAAEPARSARGGQARAVKSAVAKQRTDSAGALKVRKAAARADRKDDKRPDVSGGAQARPVSAASSSADASSEVCQAFERYAMFRLRVWFQ